jgi:DNA invertase Pin-like site-specific DNA recombinase
MARQQRSTTFAQESTRPITQVALYARVSTLNNQDPEMQLSELREYAGRRGWQIVEEFTDQGVSGCKESRPALNRLMSDACRRKFDAILVWKIDRFGRSLKHLVNSLAELAALGVAFISLRDNLDLSTPSGRLMFQIIGAMAEFERALIQERVRAGLRNARAKGRRLGRPRVIVDALQIARLLPRLSRLYQRLAKRMLRWIRPFNFSLATHSILRPLTRQPLRFPRAQPNLPLR